MASRPSDREGDVLIHKAGFHGDLEPHYTPDFIEAQAHNLACVCS